MWLLFMELEREVAEVNHNEMCTDRTQWDILCEMSALIGHSGTSCVKCLH